MKVQAGTVTALNPDHVDITGPGYHIRIVEVETGVFLVTGITDMSRSELVIRPTSRNQVLLTEDTGRGTEPSVHSHHDLDILNLDGWVEATYCKLHMHWRIYEAHRFNLREWILDQHPDVWKEFRKYVQRKAEKGS